MALTTGQRVHLYDKFKDILGEEGAEALIAQFPSGELDHPATHDFVRAEGALLRADMATLSADLRGEMAALSSELRGEMATLRKELKDELHDSHRELLRWFIGTWLTTIVLIVGLAVRVGGG